MPRVAGVYKRGGGARCDALDAFLLSSPGDRPNVTADRRMEAVWARFGDQLTAARASEYPGTRSAAWWAWSATEGRRPLLPGYEAHRFSGTVLDRDPETGQWVDAYETEAAF